jgi:hypothetical protein
VNGNATEENFSRRSTPSSKANQPFGNCILLCAFAPLREKS